MNINHQIKSIYKACKSYFKQPRNSGFSLLELLMAITVAGIVSYAMLSLVVSLLEVEKQETAKNQTQTEIGQAIDYIASEVEQAAYIYEGECLGSGRPDAPSTPTNEYCPGLANVFTFPAGVTPVLAFWKLEPVPYDGTGEFPNDCTKLPTTPINLAEECFAIKNSRRSYTLVVYGIRNDAGDTNWNGPARITRYQLRKYQSDDLQNLTKTPAYLVNNQDPQDTGFQTWPCRGSACSINQIGEDLYIDQVLVDAIDDEINSNNTCASYNYPANNPTTTYTITPLTNATYGFYACVASPDGPGGFQDAVIFIRGNAAARAGQKDSRSPVYLPTISRRVRIGTLLNRKPPEPSN